MADDMRSEHGGNLAEGRTGEALGDGVRTDSLTGLLTAPDFYRLADQALAEPRAGEGAFNFVYFNIENMKIYNERFGMEQGDALLVFAAKTIEASFDRALVSRVGDDRFALLVPEEPGEGIAKVREAMLGYDDDLRMIIRAGIFEHDGEADAVLSCDRAKFACDHIKGRYDTYCYKYDADLLAARDHRQYILDRFDKAMQQGHIQVYYQPILRTIGKQVTELEALARWIDPNDGLISPAQFIPVLEDLRLVHHLDLHVIDTVCREYGEVIERGHPLAPANVNLSRLDLELCDIVEETRKRIEKHGVPANLLNIEITESAFGSDDELLQRTIEGFHDLGIKVWMDDFGSGYSSLNVLREFPFDIVKLDMSFVRGCDEEGLGASKTMLLHIVSMLKELGFQTIAEGVETQEQYEFLKYIGCEKVQGFLFSKPTPFGELAERIGAGELGVEPLSHKGYMDKVGRVDLMDPGSIERSLNYGDAVSGGIPACIVEFHAGTVRYLAWNNPYLVYLHDIGMESIENSTKQMNDMTRLQSQGFHAAAAKQRGKDDWINLVFYEGDDLCTGRGRCIASDDEADTYAFVYIAFNVSRYLAQAGHSLPKLTG